MLKKRLIFTLLYDDGNFMLSRNFRLQKVGDLKWLNENYDFSRISYSIDELVVLDVTRGERNFEKFCETLKSLTKGCFVPIAAGGGVTNIDFARKLLRSGADKVVINSALFNESGLIKILASEFGKQCIVASVDIKVSDPSNYQIWTNNGSLIQFDDTRLMFKSLMNESIGEIYINSIDKDGTGQGLDLGILDLLPNATSKPVILAGGAGNSGHLLKAFNDRRVDAVATANLFNFIGSGLSDARKLLVKEDIDLPIWNIPDKEISVK